jgi:hypothetical protein
MANFTDAAPSAQQSGHGNALARHEAAMTTVAGGPPLRAPAAASMPPPRARLARAGAFWARWEAVWLVLWLLASGVWRGAVPWLALGLLVILFSALAREPFRRAGMGGLAGIYRAAGLAQLALGCSFVVDLGPLWPLVGLYCLGVAVCWFLIALRSAARFYDPDEVRPALSRY